MKILLVLGAGGEGGAETFYTHMALAFHRAGIETHVALRQNDNRVNLFKAAGIETQVLPFGKLFDFKTKKGLKQKIKEFKPDVVMTFMNRATSLCPKGDFLHIARLGGYYKLKNYKNCDHLIGNTKDIVDYLTSVGWPAERSHHVPNFASVETDALPVSRSDLNTPDDATVLLALGRLHENKAFDILLRAVEIETRPYVWIAGEGPLREELETLAKELGVSDRVRFLGWRNDRGALFAAADICVFPSRFEPFGSVMIEAWATNTPLVTTRTAGPEEMATDNHDALMVPVDDYKGMAAAITQMMDEKGLAERLTAAGFKTFEKDYTEEACVKNYISLFDKLLAQEKRIAS